jgi:hypothetical protein
MLDELEKQATHIEEKVDKAAKAVVRHDEWIAVREDREKRRDKWIKFWGTVVVAFSGVAASTLVYVALNIPTH